jgi:hypothetical protein
MRKAFLFNLLMILTVMLILSCSEDKKTNPDTESPIVVITYPPNNSSFVSGTVINIVAEAEDNEEVNNVKFYIDGVNSYEDSNEPYEYSWDTTDLSGSHTIYAKASDSSENTATSDIVTVTITDEGEAPNPPTNPNPQTGATNISINTTLSWTCTDPNGDQLTYDVYFGTNANPPLVSSELTVDNYNPGTLDETTTYYWYIKATDTDENSTLGSLWSFATLTGGAGQPPNPPSNPNPINNATGVSVDTILSWSCTDPDGDPLTYDVYFGTLSNPSVVSSGQSGTTYDPGTLEEVTTYYWKIKAYDDHSNNTMSTEWSFTTIDLLEILDQFQNTAINGYWVGNDIDHRWQTFIPTIDNLSKIEIYTNVVNPTGNCTIKIQDEDGSTTFAEEIFEASELPQSNWFEVNFSDNIILIVGNTYRISMYRTDTHSPDNAIYWYGYIYSNYPGYSDISYALEDFDYAFRTYGY